MDKRGPWLVKNTILVVKYELERQESDLKHLKKLTILHSNDMHGDFLAKRVDDKLLGGVSLLSGYINKVRN